MTRLDIKRVLNCRSERVKSIELHSTEPWMLCSLYNGIVHIWNYETQSLLKTFDVCEPPVRCVRFVERKNWIVTASDDAQIRVYNYNTQEKVQTIEAHVDYIRSISVHPTHPYIISSSDDATIRLFNWEKNWQLVQVFEGHSHFVMDVQFNPRDANTFASAALDNTIRVWQLGSSVPNFTLEGHKAGVNCVSFYQGSEKPYLISGADDRTAKIWDYQTKTCIQTLSGHTDNVTAVFFHPSLPIILTGSEDGTVRIWHSSTYRLENTLNYGLGRVWAMSFLKGSNYVALGCEYGSIIITLGRDDPAMSMDNNGKIVWAKNNDIQQANVKQASDQFEDGEPMVIATKDLGNTELFPHTLKHDSKGRFVVVCGDGEYIIYTALAWRNKSYGSALEFVWGEDTGEYAIRQNASKVKIFKSFKEKTQLRLSSGAEGIFGGKLLGVRTADTLAFYDWGTQELVQRIEIVPKFISWSQSGDKVAIATEEGFFVLIYNKELVANHDYDNNDDGDEGVEGAFEVLSERNDIITNGCWVGDCFLYTSASNRLNYFVGNEKSEIVNIAHLDKSQYLLGYLPKENRIYLANKDMNVISYGLDLTTLEYQTCVLRGDLEYADSLLPDIPKKQRHRIADFLDKQGYLLQALQVSIDEDQQFDLALRLQDVNHAFKIAEKADSDTKWRKLADVAMEQWIFDLAEISMVKAKDWSGLLLLFTSSGNVKGLNKLADKTLLENKYNLAFVCLFLSHRLEEALELLFTTERYTEAAFFAQTYIPTHVSTAVSKWKDNLLSRGCYKVAEKIADPQEYENLFPNFKDSLDVYNYIRNQESSGPKPAQQFDQYKDDFKQNLMALLKEGNLEIPTHSVSNGIMEEQCQYNDKAYGEEQEEEGELFSEPQQDSFVQDETVAVDNEGSIEVAESNDLSLVDDFNDKLTLDSNSGAVSEHEENELELQAEEESLVLDEVEDELNEANNDDFDGDFNNDFIQDGSDNNSFVLDEQDKQLQNNGNVDSFDDFGSINEDFNNDDFGDGNFDDFDVDGGDSNDMLTF